MSREREVKADKTNNIDRKLNQDEEPTQKASTDDTVLRPFRPAGMACRDLSVKVLGTVGGSAFSARFKIVPELTELGKAVVQRERASLSRCRNKLPNR